MPLFQAAVIPVVLWCGRKLGGNPEAAGPDDASGAAGSRRLLAAVAAAAFLIDLALAAGAPHFRCGGRGGVGFPQRAFSPMFEDLGLQETCPWSLDTPNGWWPDVLPEE